MALQKEIWIKDIQDNLFPTSSFINRSVNHSAWVDNKTVHVPQAGSNPGVSKNRSSLPGTIAQRTDTDLTYSLNEFSTNPTLLTNIDELQISYPKRMSIMTNQIETLAEVIGNHTLQAWAPTTASTLTRLVHTTGSASALALASGATGNRKAVTLADIAALRGVLDRDNVPSTGRILVMPSDMYNSQLLAIADVYQAQSYGSSALPDGVVTRLMGFDIILRPNVVQYSSGATVANVNVRSLSDAGDPVGTATSDCLGAIAYHPNYVACAMGETKIFHNPGVAEYYGDIFSSLVMHGAAKLRTDQKGIAALVQNWTA